jgi:hypothetical protein
MSSFQEIDINRKLEIWPCTDTDGLIQAIQNEKIELTHGNGSADFFDWLRQSKWALELEVCLQCVSETSAGEPLLMSWLDLEDFAELAVAAEAAGWLVSSAIDLARMRAKGCTLVVFEWFKCTQSSSSPRLNSSCL